MLIAIGAAGDPHVFGESFLYDRDLAETVRHDLALALIGQRLVIHDFNDELTMARFCEQIAPCDKTRRIREGMEQDDRS